MVAGNDPLLVCECEHIPHCEHAHAHTHTRIECAHDALHTMSASLHHQQCVVESTCTYSTYTHTLRHILEREAQ